MQWTLFATFYDNFIPPVNGAVGAMIAALAGWIGPALQSALLVYVPGRLLWSSLRPDINPIGEMEAMVIAGALAIVLASNLAWFGPYVRDLLLTALPQEIGRALLGAVGGRPVTGALFDEAWNRAWLAGLAVYKAIPWSVGGLGLMLIVVAYWLVALFSVFMAFGVWLIANMMVALLVGLGPLFVGLWLFPLTRGWFHGWLNTAMASVVLQILSVALLTLVLGAMTRLLQMIAAAARGAGGGNEIAQLQMLLGGMVLFVLCGWVAYQLPGIASSITHGFAGYGHLPRSLPRWGGAGRAQPPSQGADGVAGGTGGQPGGGAWSGGWSSGRGAAGTAGSTAPAGPGGGFAPPAAVPRHAAPGAALA